MVTSRSQPHNVRKTTGVVLFLMTILLVSVFYYTGGEQTVFLDDSLSKAHLKARLQNDQNQRHDNEKMNISNSPSKESSIPGLQAKNRRYQSEEEEEAAPVEFIFTNSSNTGVNMPMGRVASADAAFGSGSLDLEFTRTQVDIQRRRKDMLRAACKKYNLMSVPEFRYGVEKPNRFIVNRKHNLIMCSVAKIASTTWRYFFERLTGIIPRRLDISQHLINLELKRTLKYMPMYTPELAQKLLAESMTFMFSRHPFSRVLSSYRNKLDPASDFAQAVWWQKTLGWKIMYRYRNLGRWATYEEFKKNNKVYDLRFAEFVRFLGDTRDEGSSSLYNNVHWRELVHLCSPCHVAYDVIGKLETFDADVKFVLQLTNLSDVTTFLGQEVSSPTYSSKISTLEKYMADVPAEYILKLYRRYQIDFELFGYELPAFCLKKIVDKGLSLSDVG